MHREIIQSDNKLFESSSLPCPGFPGFTEAIITRVVLQEFGIEIYVQSLKGCEFQMLIGNIDVGVPLFCTVLTLC